MIDCMGKDYLKQIVFLVFYMKEHICVIKKKVTQGRLYRKFIVYFVPGRILLKGDNITLIQQVDGGSAEQPAMQ